MTRTRRRVLGLGLAVLCLRPGALFALTDAAPGSTTGDAPADPSGLALTAAAEGNMGAATVRLPIEVPPGPRDLAPDLALVY